MGGRVCVEVGPTASENPHKKSAHHHNEYYNNDSDNTDDDNDKTITQQQQRQIDNENEHVFEAKGFDEMEYASSSIYVQQTNEQCGDTPVLRRTLPNISSVPFPFPTPVNNEVDIWSTYREVLAADIHMLTGDAPVTRDGSWHRGLVIDFKYDPTPGIGGGYWVYVQFEYDPYGRRRQERERLQRTRPFSADISHKREYMARRFEDVQFEWIHLRTEGHRLAPRGQYTGHTHTELIHRMKQSAHSDDDDNDGDELSVSAMSAIANAAAAAHDDNDEYTVQGSSNRNNNNGGGGGGGGGVQRKNAATQRFEDLFGERVDDTQAAGTANDTSTAAKKKRSKSSSSKRKAQRRLLKELARQERREMEAKRERLLQRIADDRSRLGSDPFTDNNTLTATTTTALNNGKVSQRGRVRRSEHRKHRHGVHERNK